MVKHFHSIEVMQTYKKFFKKRNFHKTFLTNLEIVIG